MKLGTQLWALITVVVVIGLVSAGWFLGVVPQLQAQEQAEAQREAAVAQNEGIRATIAKLRAAEADLPQYQERAEELATVIPADIESAAFITVLNDLALASDVVIEQISISDPIAYSAPKASDDSELSPATDSRITSDNFLLVPVSIAVSGGWNEVLAFTHGLQTGERLMLVTKVSTSGDGTTFSTSLSGAMYVLLRPGAPSTATAEG